MTTPVLTNIQKISVSPGRSGTFLTVRVSEGLGYSQPFGQDHRNILGDRNISSSSCCVGIGTPI
jgi:hypothetical protein